MQMRLLAVLIILVAACASDARAQATATPQVDVSLTISELELEAGETREVEATVTNTGLVDGTVVLRMSDLGAWQATLEPDTPFSLARGDSATVRVTLTAPEAGEGSSTRTLLLEATLTDAIGRAATAASGIAVLRVDPVLPVAPTPWHEQPPILASIGLVLLAVIVALGVVRHRRRERARAQAERLAWLDRETGIALVTESGPHPYGVGREHAYRLRLANVSARPRVAVVDIVEKSPGWHASVSLRRFPLSAGESIVVTVLVRPEGAPQPGTIVVAAKPEEAQEHDDRITLVLDMESARLHARPPAAASA